MSALGIEITTRDPDVFRWQQPNTHGKTEEMLAVNSELDKLFAEYIRLTDLEPLPVARLNAIDIEIVRLEEKKRNIWETAYAGTQTASSNERI